MKYAFVATMILAAGSAQAAPLFCTTNINNDVRMARTNYTINSVGADRVEITEVTSGGMAHFITAPKKFDAHVQHFGPEVVSYTNAEQGFELEIGFQPIGGKIRGTVKTEVLGRKIQSPVVCVQAMN